MSWSVSAGGKRDVAVKMVRGQLQGAKDYGLPAAEAQRADKILDTIEEFAKGAVGADDVISVSAWGSETSWQGSITQIQANYSVSVTRAQAAPAAPAADASTAG